MPSPFTFTIASGATESDVLNLAKHSILKIEFPTMTGTSVAIQEQGADGNFKVVGNELAAFAITSPSTRSVHLYPGLLANLGAIKLVSNGAEGAARSIVVHTASYIP